MSLARELSSATNEICMYKVRCTIFAENSHVPSLHAEGKVRDSEKKVRSVTQQEILRKSLFFFSFTSPLSFCGFETRGTFHCHTFSLETYINEINIYW